MSSSEPLLYVADTANSIVYIYRLTARSGTLIGQISKGLHGPAGLALDGTGNLYVANEYAPGDVVVYPPGATKPKLKITAGLTVPQGVAVDAVGDLWVTNQSINPGIAVYGPGQTQPSTFITSALLKFPGQDQFDSSGNLYFSDTDTGVGMIPAGSMQPVSLKLQGLSEPTGLTLTAAGALYVVNFRSNHTYVTRVYKLPETKWKYDLRSYAAAHFLTNGQLGDREVIFVPDARSAGVYLYHVGEKTSYAEIDVPGQNVTIGGVVEKPIVNL